MHVRAEETNETRGGIESMLDMPPQDEASLGIRAQKFEASLAESFSASGYAEDPESAANDSGQPEQRDALPDRHAQDVPVEALLLDRASARPSPPEAEEVPTDPNEMPTEIDLGQTPASPVTMPARSVEGIQQGPFPSPEAQANPSVVRPDSGAPLQPERTGPAEDQRLGSESIRAVAKESTGPSMTAPAPPEEIVRDGATENHRSESVATKSHLQSDADRLLRPDRSDKLEPREAPRVTPGETRTAERPATVREATPDPRSDATSARATSEVDIESRSSRDSQGERRPLPDEASLVNAGRPQATTSPRSPIETGPALHAPQTTSAPTQSAAVAQPEARSELAPRQPIEALPREVELLATRGGGTARIRLHPASLGEVDITISIRRDAVDVVIHADEPAARAAILAHRDQLADALGSRELRMQGFDVEGGNREQGSADGRAGWNDGLGRRDPRPRPGDLRVGRNAANPGLERVVRAPSPGPAQRGIDVRI